MRPSTIRQEGLISQLKTQRDIALKNGTIGPTSIDPVHRKVQSIIDTESANLKTQEQALEDGWSWIRAFLPGSSTRLERNIETGIVLLMKTAQQRAGAYCDVNVIAHRNFLPTSGRTGLRLSDPYMAKLEKPFLDIASTLFQMLTDSTTDGISLPKSSIPRELKDIIEDPLIIGIAKWIDENPIFACEFEELMERYKRCISVVFFLATNHTGSDSKTEKKELHNEVSVKNLCSIHDALESTFKKLKSRQIKLLKSLEFFSTENGKTVKSLLAEFNLKRGDVNKASLEQALNYLGLEQVLGTPETSDPSGLGGFATIIQVGNNLAAKQMKTSGLSVENTCIRTLREARILSKLDHERVLKVRGYWINADDYPCLVTTYYPKGNLAEYVSREGSPVSRKEKLILIRDVAEALRYLHGCEPPIVHADVKCANVLVGNDGRAILCDFGVSRMAEDGKGFTTNGACYTDRWRAPELTLSHPMFRLPNCFTDMYAFGGMMFEVVSNGRFPGFWHSREWKWEEEETSKKPRTAASELGPKPLSPSTPADEPYPNVVSTRRDAVPNVDISAFPQILQEDWVFLLQCWNRNPWRRPSASDAYQTIDHLAGLVDGP